MEDHIYLDHSATTPVSSPVREAMEPYWANQFGNPSSPHHLGVYAERTLGKCRRLLSQLLHVRPSELFFTSGGSESNNLALQGLCGGLREPGHIITTTIEHPSVLRVVEHLEASNGWEATYLPVDRYGHVQPTQVVQAIRPSTRLVSVMLVNNELGTILPIGEIGKRIARCNQGRRNKIYFHVDGIQGVGRIPLPINHGHIDLFSISGHKIHAPKGIGLLYAKEKTPLAPLMFGGGQEAGLRSGTENVPGIVGLAKAVAIAIESLSHNQTQLAHARQFLLTSLTRISDSYVNSPDNGSPHILNIGFCGVKSEVLTHLLEQRGVYVSTGAACASKDQKLSHVLQAIGLDPQQIVGSIRLSLSPDISQSALEHAIQAIDRSVSEAREVYS